MDDDDDDDDEDEVVMMIPRHIGSCASISGYDGEHSLFHLFLLHLIATVDCPSILIGLPEVCLSQF